MQLSSSSSSSRGMIGDVYISKSFSGNVQPTDLTSPPLHCWVYWEIVDASAVSLLSPMCAQEESEAPQRSLDVCHPSPEIAAGGGVTGTTTSKTREGCSAVCSIGFCTAQITFYYSSLI